MRKDAIVSASELQASSDLRTLVDAMRRRVQRVCRPVDRVYGNTFRKVIGVGADVGKVVGRPGSLFDVPTLDGRIDRGLTVGIDLCLGGVAGDRDSWHDDCRDDAEDR